MAKLTKKAALAAYDELVEAIGGVTVQIDRKLPDEELYKAFQKQVVDLEVDEDDTNDLSKETKAILEMLAEQFAEADAEPEEEKPAKKDKKSKKGSKKEKEVEPEPEEEEEEEAPPVKKGKKSKKEAPAEKAPEPAKKEKKAKGKKGATDPAALAEELKTNRGINGDGLRAVIDENTKLFGDNAEALKAIKNPMILKKQMRNILEGGKIEMTEAKPKEKAEKPAKSKKAKAEPTLTEQVEAIDDLDELKAFAKANKDSFPGVKAKKFDKVKKLRKALLEVVVEKAAPAKKEKKAKKSNDEARAKRQEVIDWLTNQIEKAGGKIGRLKLTKAGFAQFPEAEKQVRDQISYGKNEKYNKFKEILVEVDGVIGFKSAMKGVKPEKAEKKGKKEEAPAKGNGRVKEEAKPAKEEKSGKKSKKDKKKKKNKK